MRMTQNQSSGFKFHNGQMIGQYVQLTYLMQLAIGMLQMPTTHSVKDSTGKTHLGFDANGLNDVAPMQASTVVEKLQDIG